MTQTMTDPVEEIKEDDSPGLKLMASLGIQLSGINSELVAMNRRDQMRLAMLPNTVTLEQLSNPGGATDTKDFGTPQPGRKWEVRLLMAMSNNLVANAAQVTWFIGALIPNIVPPGTLARWQFPTVPGFQTFTSSVLTVLPNQHLYAYLTGVPVSSFIALAAIIDDQPMSSQRQSVAVG